MLPAISQVCTLHAPMEVDVAEYAAAACPALEVWLTKLETYLESHSLDDARRLLDEHGMQAPVASYQGGLLTSQAEARREHWEHFERRLQLCRQLEIGTMVVAGDMVGPLSEQDIARAQMSLAQASEMAETAGVRLALEFQHQATLGNNLATAAALIAECGSPHLGLCFDVLHYYLGPSKTEDLGFLTAQNLFHVQLCDIAGVPRELATDADRVLPGDGDFWLEAIVKTLRRIDYQGCVSLELMNPQLWQVAPRSLGEVGITALRKVLGLASMGG